MLHHNTCDSKEKPELQLQAIFSISDFPMSYVSTQDTKQHRQALHYVQVLLIFWMASPEKKDLSSYVIWFSIQGIYNLSTNIYVTFKLNLRILNMTLSLQPFKPLSEIQATKQKSEKH